ncbi:hypothetical protein [Oceanimonas doudoroffii]|uniref:ABC transporter substrate-binding protein n=1 Tax=Oceanimonas doudoroffii TaxID=84158 RepID=A0A233RC31_9GAMM|nr:hypothetical protein [Oceanimonas doudoroffii]OXY80957.1 hypothetical protein B6S08_14610 [Oceanimonas doudoroffii]
MIKKICLLLLLCLGFGAQAAEPRPVLASAVPVLHALGLSLMQDTGVEVVYLPPRRLPVNRIPGWLGKADAATLPDAAALLTIESVWPALSTYPLLRQRNIAVIPVDVAQELAPSGARVTLRPNLSEPDYFWLDSNNLLLMSNVAARDLARIWPGQAEQIEANRRALQRHIQRQALAMDELLFNANIGALATEDDRLVPLVMGLALPQVSGDRADLRLDAGKGGSKPGQWRLEPLARPGKEDLAAWLSGLTASLEQALTVSP